VVHDVIGSQDETVMVNECTCTDFIYIAWKLRIYNHNCIADVCSRHDTDKEQRYRCNARTQLRIAAVGPAMVRRQLWLFVRAQYAVFKDGIIVPFFRP
jgi:hypothetical protein